MGILMLIFSLCRVLFYLRNSTHFIDVELTDFFVGMWFDCITVCLLFIPIAVIELFPNKNRNRKYFRWSIWLITFLVFFFSITINLSDIEYFAHSSARSNSSLFKMLSFGSDFSSQLPSYFKDYWYLFLLWLALLIGSFLLIKRIYKITDDSSTSGLKKQTILYILSVGFIILIARGGFVHKPIRATEASKYTSSENVQLVLNSAFTVINTIGSSTLDEIKYMTPQEARQLFFPERTYTSSPKIEGQNVVVIILESFAIEYINSLNIDEENYTPFFDQLVDSSLVFTNAFANGKKSIDAVPSILSSIPKLMPDEYLLTPYATNKIKSLPLILEDLGYSTAFYHGATNGSMNFDAFCYFAGFQKYVGRSEFNNDEFYDGTWGIWDEEFLSWTVDQLSDMKKPFFSSIFTISSHPPYALPKKYASKFKKGKSPMHSCIQYTDMALQKFFEKAQKQDWYNNTLFILTADHTPKSDRTMYIHERGSMNVPLIFYHPTDTTFRGSSDRIVGHIDIMPTILDLLGYHEPFFSFGNSVMSDLPGFTFSQIGTKKMLFAKIQQEPYVLIYEDDRSVALYHFLDLYQEVNLLDEKPIIVGTLQKKLQAIIQVYNERLIYNRMTIERE